VYADNSSLEIKDRVSLQGGNSTGYGGAIHLYGPSSRLVMSGGGIKNNRASSGGAVYINQGIFEMTGGVIGGPAGGGNQAAQGGGVYVYNGAFNMKGNAKLSGNSTTNIASGYQGGGVYLNGGTFSLSGEAGVEGNSAGEGPGVYHFTGTLSIKDDAIIDIGNPVYLSRYQLIHITGVLNGSGTVAAIVPWYYVPGLQVLSDTNSGDWVLINYNRFKVAGDDGTWEINFTGNLKH
jgi:hypothetical protein